MQYIIGIDLETTSCKCVIYDNNLKLINESDEEYSPITLSKNRIEQSSDTWWVTTKNLIKSVISESGIDGQPVKAIGISSQGISFVPVDQFFNPLGNEISWLDKRAFDEANKIRNIVGEDYIRTTTGLSINPVYVLPHLLWFRKNMSDLYKETAHILTAHDFLAHKLSGELMTNHSLASGSMLYDINNNCWSDFLMSKFDISENLLLPIGEAGYFAGKIKKSIAIDLGISDKTIISVGGQDQKYAAYGAGLKPRVITVSLGTSSAISALLDDTLIKTNQHSSVSAYLFRGSWVYEGVIDTVRACLKWLRNTMFPDRTYSDFDLLVQVDYGKLPTIFFNPELSKLDFNNFYRGNFHGISLGTTQTDLIRSVYEGIAFNIKNRIECYASQKSMPNSLRIFGGGAKSEIRCQIIADIVGLPVYTLATNETASFGTVLSASNACKNKTSKYISNAGIFVKKIYQPNKVILYFTIRHILNIACGKMENNGIKGGFLCLKLEYR